MEKSGMKKQEQSPSSFTPVNQRLVRDDVEMTSGYGEAGGHRPTSALPISNDEGEALAAPQGRGKHAQLRPSSTEAPANDATLATATEAPKPTTRPRHPLRKPTNQAPLPDLHPREDSAQKSKIPLKTPQTYIFSPARQANQQAPISGPSSLPAKPQEEASSYQSPHQDETTNSQQANRGDKLPNPPQPRKAKGPSTIEKTLQATHFGPATDQQVPKQTTIGPKKKRRGQPSEILEQEHNAQSSSFGSGQQGEARDRILGLYSLDPALPYRTQVSQPILPGHDHSRMKGADQREIHGQSASYQQGNSRGSYGQVPNHQQGGPQGSYGQASTHQHGHPQGSYGQTSNQQHGCPQGSHGQAANHQQEKPPSQNLIYKAPTYRSQLPSFGSNDPAGPRSTDDEIPVHLLSADVDGIVILPQVVAATLCRDVLPAMNKGSPVSGTLETCFQFPAPTQAFNIRDEFLRNAWLHLYPFYVTLQKHVPAYPSAMSLRSFVQTANSDPSI